MPGAPQATGWRRPGLAWLLLTSAMVALSVAAWWLPPERLDWQPALVWAQPWRSFSAAAVHWSAQHLGANLLAAAVVGAFGHAARVPPRAALAWLLAWPLTHGALMLQPQLLHYGGLSGVLHAGVAIVCVWLMCFDQGGRRWIGAGVGLGLVVKLLGELPWGPPTRVSADWDIHVAPLAHSTGAIAGLFCLGLVLILQRLLSPALSPARQTGPQP